MDFDANAGGAYSSGIMRLRVLALALLCAAVAPLPSASLALAQEQAPAKPPTERSLDELFAGLAEARTPEAARPLEREILRRFHASGSDTVDLLLLWSAQAIEANAHVDALDILDRIIAMKPDFAEAWNKRATVHFLRKQYGRSLSDIERTLALEPRHFGALTGLGFILRELGERDRAITIFRRALAVHPQMKNVREALEALEKEAAGDPV